MRWGLAIDAAGIGTFDWDLVTGRLAWDDRLIAMFGYERDDFEESIEAFNARLHPDDLPRVTEALQACIDTCGEFEAEYRVVRPDGETRWVHARGRALAGADGAADAAARRRLRHHRRARRRARAVTRVLEAMPAGFYSLDREWRFTHVNAEAERLLGPHPRGAARPGAVGGLAGGGQQRLRGELPHRRPDRRAGRPSTPTTPPRWTAGTSCAPGRAPTGCRSTSSR